MLRRVVYQYWTGPEMSPDREACFEASRDVFGVSVEMVTDETLRDYVVPGHPLHPCFSLLTPNHKSDYVRSYLLRFHGGGWADIKKYSPDHNWVESFDVLANAREADVLGEPELVRGVAFGSYKSCVDRLLVTPYLMAKADTPFTRTWYGHVVRVLDMARPLLEAHHGSETRGGGPYGSVGAVLEYPLRYFAVMGEPFHYTCVKMASIRQGCMLYSLKSGRLFAPYR